MLALAGISNRALKLTCANAYAYSRRGPHQLGIEERPLALGIRREGERASCAWARFLQEHRARAAALTVTCSLGDI